MSTLDATRERNPLKILREKEKMLMTSISSFSHNVFYPIKEKLHNMRHDEIVVCKRILFLIMLKFCSQEQPNEL